MRMKILDRASSRGLTAAALLTVAALLVMAGGGAAPLARGARPSSAVRLHVVMAQVGGAHTGTLSWTLSTDDTVANCTAPSTCSQNIYRAPGSCATVPLALVKYASVSATATGYVDITPLFGNSCYAASFVVNGVESSNSNTSGGFLQPATPTGFTSAVK